MKNLIGVAVAALILIVASPVLAQQGCGPRAPFIQHLFDKYGEVPVGRGIAFRGSVMELFVSDEGSWTLFVTRPGGLACLYATGQRWENFPIPLEQPEEPGSSI